MLTDSPLPTSRLLDVLRFHRPILTIVAVEMRAVHILTIYLVERLRILLWEPSARYLGSEVGGGGSSIPYVIIDAMLAFGCYIRH